MYNNQAARFSDRTQSQLSAAAALTTETLENGMEFGKNHSNLGKKLKDPQQRHLSDPNSRAKAIKAKCWDCCAGQREEIRFCPMIECALFAFRPYKLRG